MVSYIFKGVYVFNVLEDVSIDPIKSFEFCEKWHRFYNALPPDYNKMCPICEHVNCYTESEKELIKENNNVKEK